MLGYSGQLFGQIRIETRRESEKTHTCLVYDGQDASGTWEPSHLPGGQALGEVQPLFQKIDPKQAEEERARLGRPTTS